jgi:uncharacterized membrane protein YccC
VRPFRRGQEWLLAFDPGLVRWRLAARSTLAVAVALGVLTLLTRATGAPLTVVLLGSAMALWASMTVSDREPHAQRITTLLMPLAAGASVTIGTLASSSRIAGDSVFVVIVFTAVYIRRFGPRGFGLGMVTFFTYFISLFLRFSFKTLPWLIVALAIGTACAYLLRFVIFPDRPQRELRRTLSAAYASLGRMLDVVIDAFANGDWTHRRRRALRRRENQLNVAILAMENRLEGTADVRLSTGASRADFMLHLFDLELAAERVAGAGLARDPATMAARLDGLRALRRRLGPAGVMVRGEKPRRDAEDRLGFALQELEAALAGLPPLQVIRTAAQRGRSANDKASDSAPQEQQEGLRPTTRQAIQVGIASALAIVAGELVSPTRWYWAVITAFVVFTGTHSRGETLSKGWQRLLGTVAGVLVGVFIATAVGGQTALSLALILVCVFLAFYLFRVAYGLMIFWITILLALLYGLLGRFTPALLLLRLEETALGAVIGILVATFVLPARTRSAVRDATREHLRALRKMIDAAAARLAGREPAADPVADALALARRLQQLRAAAKPLSRGFSGALNRKGIRRSLRMLRAANHYARNLARVSRRLKTIDESVRATLSEAAGRVSGNLHALEAGTAPSPSAAELLDKVRGQVRAGGASNPSLLAAVRYLDRLDQLVSDLVALEKDPDGD